MSAVKPTRVVVLGDGFGGIYAAAAGLAAALLIGRPLAAIVGCGLVGFGIANVIPVLFGSAGRAHPDDPARALAG